MTSITSVTPADLNTGSPVEHDIEAEMNSRGVTLTLTPGPIAGEWTVTATTGIGTTFTGTLTTAAGVQPTLLDVSDALAMSGYEDEATTRPHWSPADHQPANDSEIASYQLELWHDATMWNEGHDYARSPWAIAYVDTLDTANRVANVVLAGHRLTDPGCAPDRAFTARIIPSTHAPASDADATQLLTYRINLWQGL